MSTAPEAPPCHLSTFHALRHTGCYSRCSCTPFYLRHYRFLCSSAHRVLCGYGGRSLVCQSLPTGCKVPSIFCGCCSRNGHKTQTLMRYLSATTATFSDAHYSDALQPLTFVRLRSSCLNLGTHGTLLQSKTSQVAASSDATIPLTPHWMTHNQGDATMDNAPPQPPTTALILRDVIDTDLPIFLSTS